MSFRIVSTNDFERDLKKISKKYRLFKNDFKNFIESLESNPIQGKPIGKDCFKIRLAISNKSKGKSGGARIITCVKIINEIVYLISIYDKSEMENITDSELRKRLKSLED